MLFLITAHHQSEEVNLLVIQPMCFLFHVPILTKRKKNKTKNFIPLLCHLYMLLLFLQTLHLQSVNKCFEWNYSSS